MIIQSINAHQLIALQDFVGDALRAVDECGSMPLVILNENKPVFYVVSVNGWELMHQQTQKSTETIALQTEPSQTHTSSGVGSPAIAMRKRPNSEVLTDQKAFEKRNNFIFLSEKLLDQEWERVSRNELSAASLGIQRNRLDAHVLPFFKYIAPTQVTSVELEDFASRLTRFQLSSTTISQYFVLVRKLLKLAVRLGLLKEVPEFPRIKVSTQARSMLSLSEYFKLAQTALRMSRSNVLAPALKSTDGQRERFWVAPRNMLLSPDMFWAIRFMVNSFVRPGDLRQLKHKHVTVVRGTSVYLRLNLPETKKHDKPMVTMSSAVHVYEALLRHRKAHGYGDAEDYLFLPAEKDRNYALAVLGFWFKWVMREAGLATHDEMGRPRTLYCLRHTAIMFRLLFGHGIDMLTLARNARTSVQMIERFYASSLDGEMNVTMIQSRRPGMQRRK